MSTSTLPARVPMYIVPDFPTIMKPPKFFSAGKLTFLSPPKTSKVPGGVNHLLV